MRTPRGFLFGGAHAGIKGARPDMALIVSQRPATAVGLFTKNLAAAYPVRDARRKLPSSELRAILINSGNANALSGPDGATHVTELTGSLAALLEVSSDQVVTASTGLIGAPLPLLRMRDALPQLVAALGSRAESAAEAIITTDTCPKLAHAVFTQADASVTVTGLGKGSGMVAPELATVLAFLLTDASLSPDVATTLLAEIVRPVFESLSIDGETSTNDSVILVGNGMAGAPPVQHGTPEYAALAGALEAVCLDLVKAMAADGEGATKRLTVHIEGAPSTAIARDLARAVVSSPLVKAAVFGADPNWGRVLSCVGARAGKLGYPIDPLGATVTIQGEVLYHASRPTSALARARARLREPDVALGVDLHAGACEATAFGCDLSYEYVKINADYMSVTEASDEGTVSRNHRLADYTPGFKRAIVVEALSYMSRFAKTRAVIKYGGAAMVKDTLVASFARDVELLRSAGLLPIVVHGASSEVARTLSKYGMTSAELIETGSLRASDPKLAELVLTGHINAELVALLNARDGRAVGVSGKDAGFLRAKRRGDPAEGTDAAITSVDPEYLEMLLEKGYVPIISPMAMGDNGESLPVSADEAAAEIAMSSRAAKLIYVTNVPGILDGTELVSEMTASELAVRKDAGQFSGGMLAKAQAALRAIEAGVGSVHIVDGRVPHALIAELFTDKGFGTVIRAR